MYVYLMIFFSRKYKLVLINEQATDGDANKDTEKTVLKY